MRRIFVLALTAATAAAIYGWLRHISATGHRGPVSDHFDGERFHNLEPTPDKSLLDLLRWRFGGRPEKQWAWRDIQPSVPPARVDDLRVTLVNHATILIQTAGLNILTDPIWSERTSPISWAGPHRYHAPGIRFEDLPPIDVVLLSHNHWDHLDLPTLQRLGREHRPLLVVPLGNKDFLERHGVVDAVEVDWWDSVPLGRGVEAISVPVQHWSTRTRLDLRKTLWCGYVIKGPAGNIYFAGDTGFGSGKVFRLARDRYGPFRLAFFPIGAFLPRWFMKDNHLSPADAVEAQRILGARTNMAMHFGCFDLGNDSQDEAANALRAAANPEFWIPEPGESRHVP